MSLGSALHYFRGEPPQQPQQFDPGGAVSPQQAQVPVFMCRSFLVRLYGLNRRAESSP